MQTLSPATPALTLLAKREVAFSAQSLSRLSSPVASLLQPPAVAHTLFVTCLDGSFHLIDAKTGSILASGSTPAPCLTGFLFGEDAKALGGSDSHACLVDLAGYVALYDWKRRSLTSVTASPPRPALQARPAGFKDAAFPYALASVTPLFGYLVLAAGSGGFLSLIDTSQTSVSPGAGIRWTQRFPSPLFVASSSLLHPAPQRKTAFTQEPLVIATPQALLGLNLKTGSPLWQIPLPSSLDCPPYFDRKTLFFSIQGSIQSIPSTLWEIPAKERSAPPASRLAPPPPTPAIVTPPPPATASRTASSSPTTALVTPPRPSTNPVAGNPFFDTDLSSLPLGVSQDHAFPGIPYVRDEYKPIWTIPLPSETPIGRPLFYDGAIFLSTSRFLRALDLQTGRERWSRKFSDGATFSAPSAGSKRLFFGEKHFLYALHSDTGRESWKFLADGKILHPPTIWGGRVFFSSANRYLYAADARSGSPLWSERKSKACAFSPLVKDDRVFAAALDGQIYAHDVSTGRRIWSCALGSDPACQPVRNSTDIFIVDQKKILYAIRQSDGSIRWDRPLQTTAIFGLACTEDIVIASHAKAIEAFDSKVSLPRWSNHALVWDAPLLSSDDIYAAKAPGSLLLFDLRGKILQSMTFSSFLCTFAVSQGHLCTYEADGSLSLSAQERAASFRDPHPSASSLSSSPPAPPAPKAAQPPPKAPPQAASPAPKISSKTHAKAISKATQPPPPPKPAPVPASSKAKPHAPSSKAIPPPSETRFLRFGSALHPTGGFSPTIPSDIRTEAPLALAHQDAGNTGFSPAYALLPPLKLSRETKLTSSTPILPSSSPLIVDGKAYLVDQEGHLFCTDPEIQKAGASNFQAEAISSPLAAAYGRIYVGTKGWLLSLSQTGEIRWKQHLGGWATAPVVIRERFLAAVSQSGHYGVFDAYTGTPLWEKQAGSMIFPPALTDDQMIAVTEKGKFYGHDRKTGVERWTWEFYEALACPFLVSERIYLITEGNYLAAFFPSKEPRQESLKLKSGPLFPMVFDPHDRVLVVICKNGEILGFDPDLKPLWTLESPFTPSAPMLMAENFMYLPCGDGMLHIYEIDSKSPRPIHKGKVALHGSAKAAPYLVDDRLWLHVNGRIVELQTSEG